MKKIKKPLLISLSIMLVAGLFLYFQLQEVLGQKLKVYKSSTGIQCPKMTIDSSRKNVLIIADNEGTEMFDLMAPFFLFNTTGKANVMVVSEKKSPILLVNSLFILPHFTFSEIDSLHIIPDVIVIPNLTIHLKTPPKPSIVRWIKTHYSGKNILLSICDGSATAAATGIYDGKPLTTHASDYEILRKQFPKPAWVKNISVTASGNLYSTAGVSNAVEGSLTVIKKLFGEETMRSVLHQIRYPHTSVKLEHQSDVVNKGAIIKIASKVLFRKSYKVGVLLTDSLNEFELASVLDTYVRTFPKSINSFSIDGSSVTSRYGLTIYPTGNAAEDQVNEVHLVSASLSKLMPDKLFNNAQIVKYDKDSEVYAIDRCLTRIENLYGSNFKNCVKLMLDYN